MKTTKEIEVTCIQSFREQADAFRDYTKAIVKIAALISDFAYYMPPKGLLTKTNSMKKSIILLLFFAFGLNGYAQEKNYSLAYVGEKIDGVYIFVLAEPANAYDYIATVKVDITWTGTIEENFEKAINKAKKKYPYFNGMIFQKKDMSKADLIKFTDLDIVRGGLKLNGKVSFINKNSLIAGEIVELGKDKASVSIIEDGRKVVKKLDYKLLTPISEEKYQEIVNE
jgi:hypothetical protein